MKRRPTLVAGILVFGLLADLAGRWSGIQARPRQTSRQGARYVYNGKELQEPKSEFEIEWLRRRKLDQEEQALDYKVFHGFKFVDKVPESGITFKHSIVDDAAKLYHPIHYDHGNGVAAADVDGDGLYDIYFVNQLGCSELWRNLGNGRVENITQQAGVGLCDRIGVTASFADINNDGRPDLFVTTVKTGNVLFENLGHGRFKDITQQAGLNYSGHSSGAVFFDFNRDGLVDLFLCNVGRYTTDQKGTGGYYLGMTDGFTGHLFPERTEPCVMYKNL